ncbi:hypothetical protein AB6O49_34290 [Streptomyces sp. SBR177]
MHDLGLPLSFAGRPVASLTPADKAALDTFLADRAAAPRSPRPSVNCSHSYGTWRPPTDPLPPERGE